MEEAPSCIVQEQASRRLLCDTAAAAATGGLPPLYRRKVGRTIGTPGVTICTGCVEEGSVPKCSSIPSVASHDHGANGNIASKKAGLRCSRPILSDLSLILTTNVDG